MKQILFSSAKNRTKNSILISIVFLILMSFLILYFFFWGSPYKKGVEHIKNKRYNEALIQFSQVDTTDENYNSAISKINFVKGIIRYDSLDFENAHRLFSMVDESDEFYLEAKKLVSKLESNPEFIYNKGVLFIKEKNYVGALKEFEKIKSSDNNYVIAQKKINFLKGKIAYEEKDYSLTFQYLESIDQSDDLFQEAKKMLDDSKQSLSFESNKYFISELIKIIQKFEQEIDISQNYKAYDIKMITIRNLANIKQEFANTKSYAFSEDLGILRYKDLAIQWMNSWINRVNSYSQALQLSGGNPLLREMLYEKTRSEYQKEQNSIQERIDLELEKIQNKYGPLS